jgi:hypothetical protein
MRCREVSQSGPGSCRQWNEWVVLRDGSVRLGAHTHGLKRDGHGEKLAVAERANGTQSINGLNNLNERHIICRPCACMHASFHFQSSTPSTLSP